VKALCSSPTTNPFLVTSTSTSTSTTTSSALLLVVVVHVVQVVVQHQHAMGGAIDYLNRVVLE
jgi:hypothetical protein